MDMATTSIMVNMDTIKILQTLSTEVTAVLVEQLLPLLFSVAFVDASSGAQ